MDGNLFGWKLFREELSRWELFGGELSGVKCPGVFVCLYPIVLYWTCFVICCTKLISREIYNDFKADSFAKLVLDTARPLIATRVSSNTNSNIVKKIAGVDGALLIT